MLGWKQTQFHEKFRNEFNFQQAFTFIIILEPTYYT